MRVNLGDSPFACPRATLEGISAVASGVRLDAQILSRPVALSQTHDQVPCFTQSACVCVVYVCLSVSLLYTRARAHTHTHTHTRSYIHIHVCCRAGADARHRHDTLTPTIQQRQHRRRQRSGIYGPRAHRGEPSIQHSKHASQPFQTQLGGIKERCRQQCCRQQE